MFLECDFEGKFLSVDNDIRKRFGYFDTNFFSEKRIFNLIHPDSVIDFIYFYNNFLSNKIDFFEKGFYCIDNNKKKFYCLFLFKKVSFKLQICIDEKTVFLNEKTSFFNEIKKLFFLMRIKFVIGSLMPFIFALCLSYYKYGFIFYDVALMIFFSLIFLHISANTFNDYFDWKSGRDKKNTDYLLLSTGGSRSIDFDLISEKKMLILSLFFSFLTAIIGFYLFILKGVIVFILGLISFFSVYFYSAPPIHLASRYGVGELMHIICLGPLIIYGTVYVVTGINDVSNFLIGLPHGFLITGCLLINEYPDSNFDKISGKNNLAVILGAKGILYIYLLLILLSFCIIFYFICCGFLSFYFFLVFLLFPYTFSLFKFIFTASYNIRSKMLTLCLKSLNIYIYYSILLITSTLLNIFF